MKNKLAPSSLYIGTSGWSYPDWQEFFNGQLPSREQLAYYAKHFNTGEYNRSFYNVTRETTFLNFKQQVPADFIFSIKANKRITHIRPLQGEPSFLLDYLKRFEILGNQLGPILFQLPPSFALDLSVLKHFIKLLPKTYRYTFEFRNPTWHCQEVYDVLLENNIAFCLFDLAGKQTPITVTADFVYIRLHGEKQAYRGAYAEQILNDWAKRINEWQTENKSIFCYFDNSIGGHAPLDAIRLRDKINLSSTHQ